MSAVSSHNFDLSQQTALVTGAGSGFGRSISMLLASRGATVICADRDLSRADETSCLIGEQSGQSVPLRIDVTSTSSVDEAISRAAKQCGGLDILINNAGIISNPTRAHELSNDDWDRVLDVDLKGVFLCSRATIPLMLKSRGGSIINIASIVGMRGFYPGFPCVAANYAAAKAGVVGLTRQIAAEYASENIRANAIAPGFHVGTRLSEERRSVSSASDILLFDGAVTARTPMGRKGTTDELASLALYLASGASAFVTGQVFTHDGGWTAT